MSDSSHDPREKTEMSEPDKAASHAASIGFADQIKRAERWMIALTLALVIFSLLSAVAFFGQLNVMKKQLGVMENQLDEMRSASQQVDQTIVAFEKTADATIASACSVKAQARARLIQKVERTHNLKNPSNMYVEISFQNVGNTPAYKVSRYGDLFFAPHPLADFAKSQMQLDGYKEAVEQARRRISKTDNLVLQPSQKNTFRIYGNQQVERAFAKWRAMNEGERQQNRLYIGGIISYSDVFGAAHYSKFCVGYSWDAVRIAISNPDAGLDGLFCDGYNDADLDSPCP
jgi:type II secretory pathway pseudopilin PulG